MINPNTAFPVIDQQVNAVGADVTCTAYDCYIHGILLLYRIAQRRSTADADTLTNTGSE